MAEAMPRRAQHPLAQDAAMGLHEGEGGVVADGADIAEVIGDALELRHHRAQPDGAAWYGEIERGLDGAREGERMGDRAVARDPRGEACRLARLAPAHQ